MNSMHTACLEELFVVFEGHDSATLHTYPPAGADPDAKMERYLVSGPHRLFRFGTERKTVNFGTWRLQMEGEGFYFDPLEFCPAKRAGAGIPTGRRAGVSSRRDARLAPLKCFRPYRARSVCCDGEVQQA
jgi:hypothetical protein